MYPSKKDYSNISNLNTIIPGINKIYNLNNKDTLNTKYSFKTFELIKKYMNK